MATTRTLTQPSVTPNRADEQRLALVVAWCAAAPARSGEIFLLPGEDEPGPVLLGRAEPGRTKEGLALAPYQQRPGRNDEMPPLPVPSLSRHQLRFLRTEGGWQMENIGRCPLLYKGRTSKGGALVPGDVWVLRSTLVLVVVERPRRLPALRSWPKGALPAFGRSDRFGLVGESPAAWALREQAAFAAGRAAHVLVHGDSGSGKELVARAIHGLGSRAGRPLISRNAATIPEGLVDAELFGNIADYPNPGMPARPGLVGEADGSTLFLDEVGEVPEATQAHLLRVLDRGGEYTRLGEARPRHADIRLVAATNRPPAALKHDLLARLRLRLRVPGMVERKEDIPLLALHLLRRAAEEDPELGERFFEGETPRISTSLVGVLTGWRYTHHVRELDTLLWRALSTSPGDRIELTEAVTEDLRSGPESTSPPAVRVEELSAEAVQQALDENNGVLEATWRALGLKNRFQLIRLVKKHGLRTSR